ncbi:SURF1 family protein [Ferrimonas gelatinilytica]|uniref:SURF1-like protein n=1 Tax=Ferrimonas gelatinilytica TaxID=1255257 RepID=A0ABP9SBZ6_9GAMM
MTKVGFLGALLTVLACIALVKLGLWQLDRAEEKRHWMAQLEQRGTQTLDWPLSGEELTGYRLSVEGYWLPQHALLLDNQVWEGRVGYRWLVPVQIHEASPWLLVDLGFVTAPRHRQALPELPTLPTQSALVGRLRQPGANRLSSRLSPERVEPSAPLRVQALNWTELSALWQHPVVPALLWLQQPAELGFERPWQPINLAPEKHQAYALQWFSLAAACLVIALVVARRRGLHAIGAADNLNT